MDWLNSSEFGRRVLLAEVLRLQLLV